MRDDDAGGHVEETATAAAWIAAVVLLLAGLAKLARPEGTQVALRDARLPSHPALVRLLGAGEVALAVVVIAVGGVVPTVALATAYLGFVVFAAAHRRRPGASCGCFGEASAPMRLRHVLVDAAVALAVLAAATVDVAPASQLTAVGAGPALATVAAVALAGWLVRLHLTDAAALDEAVALHRGGTP